jgi:hypothetical protein
VLAKQMLSQLSYTPLHLNNLYIKVDEKNEKIAYRRTVAGRES